MKKVTFLSIDLPWSADNFTAVTYYSLVLDASGSHELVDFRSRVFRKKQMDLDYAATIKTMMNLTDPCGLPPARHSDCGQHVSGAQE